MFHIGGEAIYIDIDTGPSSLTMAESVNMKKRKR